MRKKEGLSISDHDIEGICRKTTDSLIESLDVFWPGFQKKQNNFMSERNLSLHFASECRKRGLHVYAEVSYEGADEAVQKIDLLILSPPRDETVDLIAVEVKRMWRANEYDRLRQDMEKIKTFYRSFEAKMRREEGWDDADFPYRIGRKMGLIANLSWENLGDREKAVKERTEWDQERLRGVTEPLKLGGRTYGFPLTAHDPRLDHYESIASHALFYEFELPGEGMPAVRSA